MFLEVRCSLGIQFCTCGPANGASRRLRFIDGKLVEIRVER